MCEDREINHTDCRTGRKVIFGTTPSPVSSFLSSPGTCFGVRPVCVAFFIIIIKLEIKSRMNEKALITVYVMDLWPRYAIHY